MSNPFISAAGSGGDTSSSSGDDQGGGGRLHRGREARRRLSPGRTSSINSDAPLQPREVTSTGSSGPPPPHPRSPLLPGSATTTSSAARSLSLSSAPKGRASSTISGGGHDPHPRRNERFADHVARSGGGVAESAPNGRATTSVRSLGDASSPGFRGSSVIIGPGSASGGDIRSAGPHRRTHDADDDASTPPIRRIIHTAALAAQALFGLFAALLFLFGITNRADLLVGSDHYDEVCTVLGSLFVFPFIYSTYKFLSQLLPKISSTRQIQFWIIGLRVLLIVAYVAQQGLLMVYMVRYVGRMCWLFVIPDVALAFIMVSPARQTALWTTIYVLIFSSKIAIFWPNLDQSNAENNPFADRSNALGPNGFLSICFLTIPVIQFPVLVSRLRHGMKIAEAYTVNMAAVFAHTLHFMDVLELYFLGLERLKFAEDVQYLMILFAIMGCVTCNLYYVSLFFRDDTAERFSKKYQPTSFSVLGGEESASDETLLHYFVWIVFFIDLPYLTMRSIAWLVHGTMISVFFAKNLMMMASVATLLISHSRRQQHRTVGR